MRITIELSDNELDAIIEALEEKIYTTDNDSEMFYQLIIEKFNLAIKEAKC